jgi:hypothetical protein
VWRKEGLGEVEQVILSEAKNPKASSPLPSVGLPAEALAKAGEGQGEGEAELPARLQKKPKSIKKLTPNAMVKKMKFGKYRIACCLDHYGPEKPECFTEGTVIYINRDHPLYKRESRTAATYTMYIARLLTQEVALMKDIKSPRRAFDIQSRLLRDAFLDK